MILRLRAGRRLLQVFDQVDVGLLGFVGQIEAEVRKQLDEALAKESAKAARPAAKPAKPAAKAAKKK